jgi:hypothetical protein
MVKALRAVKPLRGRMNALRAVKPLSPSEGLSPNDEGKVKAIVRIFSIRQDKFFMGLFFFVKIT